MPYDFTCMWNLKNKTKQKNRLIEIENKLIDDKGGEGSGVGEKVKGNKKYKP